MASKSGGTCGQMLEAPFFLNELAENWRIRVWIGDAGPASVGRNNDLEVGK